MEQEALEHMQRVKDEKEEKKAEKERKKIEVEERIRQRREEQERLYALQKKELRDVRRKGQPKYITIADEFKEEYESESLLERKRKLEDLRKFKRPVDKQEIMEHQSKYQRI